MNDRTDNTATPARKDDKPPLIRELYKRGVVQAGLAYLLVGWLLIQVADVTADDIGLPLWTGTFVTFTVIAGFPVALLLAWFLEYTEGRHIVDQGRQRGRLIAGIGSNYVAVIGAYAIAAIGMTVYQATVGLDVPAPEEQVIANERTNALAVHPNSIAVLKFRNIDQSETSRIFSEGLAEDLLDQLAKLPGLLVSSRSDSWSLPELVSSPEVRRRLRVAYFVEGSVQLEGDTLRTTVQLIDSSTGFHVVSRNFDRALANVLEMQNDITGLITANLRVALPASEELSLPTRVDPDNVNAYVLYRRGKEIFDQPQTEESLQRVLELYVEALELDPGFAAAHSEICVTYVTLHEISSSASHITAAESACELALQAGGNLYIVYRALGELYHATGRFDAAEDAYDQALVINPQDAESMRGLAAVYETQLRLADAEALLGEAIRLQPGNWRSIDSLGWFYFVNGRYAEAVDTYRLVTELDPRNWQGHGNLGNALLMVGEIEAAGNSLRRALESESDPVYQSSLGIIHYYLGEFDDAVAIHLEVVEAFPDSSLDWLNLADAYSFSSTPDEAEAAYRTAASLSEEQLEVNAQRAGTLYRLAWSVANLGDLDRAGELISRSRHLDPNDPYVYYYSGLINVREGRLDAAVANLRQAVEAGYPVRLLDAEPLLAELRDSPAFRQLVD